MIRTVLFITFLLGILACKQNTNELPYLGNVTKQDGQTLYHRTGEFAFYNQDSVLVTHEDLKNYIYVTDFFFTSCPSICPKVMKEMLKIYEEVKTDTLVKLVSFTIDPKRDTPSKLKLYADNLGIEHDKWWFLSGDKDLTFELANTYFIAALEDEDAPGGFDHSGKIVLVDKDRHVRSFSDGTDPSKTQKLIQDIKRLSKMYTDNAN